MMVLERNTLPSRVLCVPMRLFTIWAYHEINRLHVYGESATSFAYGNQTWYICERAEESGDDKKLRSF